MRSLCTKCKVSRTGSGAPLWRRLELLLPPLGALGAKGAMDDDGREGLCPAPPHASRPCRIGQASHYHVTRF